MLLPDAEDGWAALFLHAISPGQIIRYLERRHKAGHIPSGPLFVSDAVGVSGLRALIGGFSAGEWMETAGPTVSNVFPTTSVSLLWQRSGQATAAASCSRSGFVIWKDGTEIERGEIEPGQTKTRGIVARLLKNARTRGGDAVLTWAAQRNLPASRVPALRKRGPALTIVDYNTVSRLDQKSLLIENSPRLYRFDL